MRNITYTNDRLRVVMTSTSIVPSSKRTSRRYAKPFRMLRVARPSNGSARIESPRNDQPASVNGSAAGPVWAAADDDTATLTTRSAARACRVNRNIGSSV
jgi:hypothetical protein